jgi:hypothetical protein
MIAGRIHLCGRTFRILMDTEALGRVAACASAGIDGPAGEAETKRFMLAVIDPRDQVRWARLAAAITADFYTVACAEAIAAITGRAARSEDADDRQWAWDMRNAIERFQSGEVSAFAEMAARQAARWA